MSKILVVILTFNEEKNIEECIKSCNSIANEVLVLDGGSTDSTCLIAKENGAKVVCMPVHPRERIHYVLNDYRWNADWIMFLDADERMTELSRNELRDKCNEFSSNEKITGIVVKYQTVFLGKELKHGGYGKIKKLRCFKPNAAFYENEILDEHFILRNGECVVMKNTILHCDFKGLFDWVNKHNIYATRAAQDFKVKVIDNEKVNYSGLERTIKLKRILKYKVFYKLPSNLRAKLFYLYTCYIRLGFLDGKIGKMYSFLHSYRYRYLVDCYIYEEQKQ